MDDGTIWVLPNKGRTIRCSRVADGLRTHWNISRGNRLIFVVRPHEIDEEIMHAATFNQVQPILGTRDVAKAVRFYIDQLGFALAFGDPTNEGNYVGIRRDKVELHMQFQYEYEMSTIRLRLLVDDPDALFTEYHQRGVECSASGIYNTAWGTREFALYDTDRNSLTFYRDLKNIER